MGFEFTAGSHICFGKGALSGLPRQIKKLGMTRVMVVFDPGVKAAGIAGKVVDLVAESGVSYTVFEDVIPNPTNEIVEQAAKEAKKFRADGFVAVGGGSSIDTAKAVNVLMTNEGKISDYAGIGAVKHNCLPLIAIPTTAGTSSEITNVSALIDTEKVIKYVVIDDKLTPAAVIADPDLTKTVPPMVTAATGMDAMTHALESYISNMASPLTKYHSLEGLRLLHRNLEKAVENGDDEQAREGMMLGCIITGFAFSNANLGFVHGIAHTLSAHFGISHGEANATVLPYVMEYNAAGSEKEMGELAAAMGLTLSGDLYKDAYLPAGELKRMAKAVGIRSLSELGVSKEDFSMLADDVLREPVLGFNPRQGITKDDVIAILEKAW